MANQLWNHCTDADMNKALEDPSQNTRGGDIDGETEEEHAVRFRKISEEVKADIEAGRYAHGQLHPNISAQEKQVTGDSWIRQMLSSDTMMMQMAMRYGGTMSGRLSVRPIPMSEMYVPPEQRGLHIDMESHDFSKMEHRYLGRKATMMYMDDLIDSPSIWKTSEPEARDDGPTKPYWKQPIPGQGPAAYSSTPSEEKRALLRAKRRKKKGK